MEIVSAGSLESISRPSSTTSEKGRKSQLQRLQPSSSLEVLPSEDISGLPYELFSAIENDVNIEDFEDDLNSDDSEEEYEQHKPTLYARENTNESRETESRASCVSGSQEEIPALTEEESEVDPQIKEGMEKIKKLDRILADKIKKEKEVKNQRTQMEKMWKEQLQQMAKISEDDGSHSHKNLIESALLALELGNENSLGSSRDEPATPIFATQPLGTEESHPYCQSSLSSGRPSRGSSCSSRDEKRSKKTKTKRRDKKSKRSQNEADKSCSNKKQSKTKETGQDFIERNKKLAADAANVIPMTDEEKERLEKLLTSDVNEMMENPFTDDGNLRLTQGIGFTPDEESARALADIDRKLQDLVPANELELLSSRALTDTPLSERSAVSETDSEVSSKRAQYLDNADIGERVLREEKEARTTHQRIMDIENELAKLRQLSENDTDNTISQALLAKLINEDSRTTSSSSTIAESVMSSLTTPDLLAIEHQSNDPYTTTTTPTTLRTVSALSDVTLTSDDTITSDVTDIDVDTPRTLTDSINI